MFPSGQIPLGTLLVEQGILTPEQLEAALLEQAATGGRLGDIVVARGYAKPVEVYRVLAEQLKHERVIWPPRLQTLRKLPEDVARRLGAVVIDEDASQIWVAVHDVLDDARMRELTRYLDKPIRPQLATRYELEQLWNLIYADEMRFESVERLAEEQPQNSASSLLTRAQILVGVLALIALGTGFALVPRSTALTINLVLQLCYALFAWMKGVMLYRGAQGESFVPVTDEDLAALSGRDLPTYTILVPLYREANVLPGLLEHLMQLDYPKHKLDIRLLFEEDDMETLQAARALSPPYYVSFVVVPKSHPQTKPKACNFGLIHARGEFVVIYDAEDRPELDQLKRVIAAFRKLPPEYACVQAKLNYYNASQNLLTRWFAQEYSNWFGILLPGVMAMDVPIPLGGTSNHFRTEVLRKVGAWDPFNVTEDADLGVRLYKHGYQTALVDSTTWEEANSQVRSWIRQRARWVKGYLITWLVNMRHPVQLWRDLGTKGFWGFQAMILGTPFLPLVNPFFWLLLILWFVCHAPWIPMLFPSFVYYLASVLLFIGNFVFVYSNLVGMYIEVEKNQRRGSSSLSFRLVFSAILSPLYWFLMSVATYRALWELIRRPFHWNKTPHGLTRSKVHLPSEGEFTSGTMG